MWRCLLTLAALLCFVPLAAQRQTDKVNQLQKFIRVYQYLSKIYVDEVDMAPLTERAISSMLEELDPHSAYIDRETMRGVKEELDGAFGGIGAEFGMLRDTLRVVETLAGTPARRGGLLPGDCILRIDTLPAVGLDRNEAVRRIRGRRGSKVRLDILRGEREHLAFELVRDDIPLNTVECAYMAEEGVGYIRIARFGHTTYDELVAAYRRLHKPRHLILDLRGNGGGLLDQAVEVAGFFLPKNSVVVSTEGRAVPHTEFRTRSEGMNTEGGLAVLIDENSASASEIVTGAIQDWDRGVVIGRRSFGKGLVQRQIELGDGSAVRITMARYHTPSGRVIQRPYTKGDRRTYYREHLLRHEDGSRDDSIPADAPRYFTLRRQRPVFGGGGIRPDRIIPTDTAGRTAYGDELVRRGILGEFVLAWTGGRREQLRAQWGSAQRFAAEFAVGQPLADELDRFARSRGIGGGEGISEQGRAWIALRFKALAAQNLFGDEGFWRVVNSTDRGAFGEALNVLKHWEEAGIRMLDGETDAGKYENRNSRL